MSSTTPDSLSDGLAQDWERAPTSPTQETAIVAAAEDAAKRQRAAAHMSADEANHIIEYVDLTEKNMLAALAR
eukprot:7624781-Pyramimonas_sp.AAC.1